MLRDLFKEGGLYTLASFLTKGVSLFLVPFYTSYFSTVDYGIIDMISVFGAILIGIVSFQLNQGVGRYVADSSISKDSKKRIASSSLYGTILAYILVLAYVWIWPETIQDLLGSENVKIPIRLIKLAVLASFLGSIFIFMGSYMRFLRKVKLYTILNFSYTLVSVGLMILLIGGFDLGIDGIYYSTIILAPIWILVSLISLRKEYVLYFGFEELKKVFVYSAPLVPAIIAVLLLNTIDRFFIKELLTFSELGMYGLAFKFSSIIGLIISGFSMALAPITFEKYHTDDYSKELNRFFKLFLLIGVFGLTVLSIFSEETVMIFSNENYQDADLVMPILYANVLVTGLGLFSPGINIKKKTYVSSMLVVMSSIINGFLTYYGIQFYGLIGAAVATFISVLSYHILYYFIANTYFKVNLSMRSDIVFIGVHVIFIIFGSYLLRFGFSINLLLKITIGLISLSWVYFKFKSVYGKNLK